MGGIFALVFAFGCVLAARKLCDLIRAPRWFAKLLFICAALVATSLLAETVVSYTKHPWVIWAAVLGTASGIIPVGFIMFKHIEDSEGKEQNRKRIGFRI